MTYQAGTNQTLAAWGEFRLLNEVIRPILGPVSAQGQFGDDCAYLDLGGEAGFLAVTADSGPRPAVWALGERSYWTWGWYLVAINVSDLAAGGARPLAIADCVEAPPSFPVGDLRDFFEGVAAACREFSITSAGGNIRASEVFRCDATAVGRIKGGPLLRREGCRPGDVLVVIGDQGRFAVSYLRARRGGVDALSPDDHRRLHRPKPPVNAMAALREAGVLRAASDNSDGFLGALWNIAERSRCAMEVDMVDERLPPDVVAVAQATSVDPWNVLFFWGDWHCVVAADSSRVNELATICMRHDTPFRVVGRAIEGEPALVGVDKGRRRRLRILRNENFVEDSFNLGLDAHVKQMFGAPLYEEPSA